jgi:hypothetical protein
MLNPHILSPDALDWLAQGALSELNANLCEAGSRKGSGAKWPGMARAAVTNCRAVALATSDETEKQTWLDVANQYEATIQEGDHPAQTDMTPIEHDDLIDHSRPFAGYDSNGTPWYASTITARLAKPGEEMCGRCGCVQNGDDIEICPGCGNNQPTIICETSQNDAGADILETACDASSAAIAVSHSDGATTTQVPKTPDESAFQSLIVEALAEAYSTTPGAVRQDLVETGANEVLEQLEGLMLPAGY